jgi:hypothetical protein
MKKLICIIATLSIFITNARAQDPTNYDESKVPYYELPQLLVSVKGKPITNSKEWMEIRRPEILSLFEENMYGKIPGTLDISSYKIIEKDTNALGNKAIRKQLVLTFSKSGKELNVNLLIYLQKTLGKLLYLFDIILTGIMLFQMTPALY